MKFIVNSSQLSLWRGLIQILPPTYLSAKLDKLAGLIEAKKHTFEISITLKKQKRSLSANNLMWQALQDLAMHYNTGRWELYIKYLREYGVCEYLAVIPEAIPRVRELFRVVDEKGKVKTENGVELVRLRCYPGSSTYNTKEFSYLLDMILQDAKKIGFDYVTEEEKALLLEIRESEARKDG